MLTTLTMPTLTMRSSAAGGRSRAEVPSSVSSPSDFPSPLAGTSDACWMHAWMHARMLRLGCGSHDHRDRYRYLLLGRWLPDRRRARPPARPARQPPPRLRRRRASAASACCSKTRTLASWRKGRPPTEDAGGLAEGVVLARLRTSESILSATSTWSKCERTTSTVPPPHVCRPSLLRWTGYRSATSGVESNGLGGVGDGAPHEAEGAARTRTVHALTLRLEMIEQLVSLHAPPSTTTASSL